MKKLFVLIALSGAICLTANADVIKGEAADGLLWSYNTDTKTLSFAGKGAVPSNSQGMAPWSAYSEQAVAIVLSEGITSVGEYAFNEFKAVTSVSLPESLRSIEQYAFQNCKSLHELKLGKNVSVIGQWAFAGCFSLTSLVIPNSVTEIRYRAFDFVPNVEYLNGRTSTYGARTVNGYVENDFVYADSTKHSLSACSAVHGGDLKIDESVHAVEEDAFRGCKQLRSVIFGDSLQTIQSNAFYENDNLIFVTLGAGIKELDRYALQCRKLKALYIKAKEVPETSSYTFYGVRLSEVTLYVPKGTEEAYKNASVWNEFGTVVAK